MCIASKSYLPGYKKCVIHIPGNKTKKCRIYKWLAGVPEWNPGIMLHAAGVRDHISQTMYMRWNKCYVKLQLLLMEGCVNSMVVKTMETSSVWCSQW